MTKELIKTSTATPSATHDAIAQKLEQAFAIYGFATPNVATLKEHSGTTLKTLYKYFPSKEAMVIGALHYRHKRYIAFLEQDSPINHKITSVHDANTLLLHIFTRLALWLETYAPRGCMSLQALACYPNNEKIQNAVQSHKLEVKQWLTENFNDLTIATAASKKDFVETIFILHEGMASAWPSSQHAALKAAHQAISILVEQLTQK
ncbi:hypothetical protein KUC3_22480 [Alteromonas sp. KC3]|uniref:TetR/AcrR family transcriptional regulator n=1 Tax=unclassified Alteromonas TaxID=2614992 RepID=UPI0019356C57|nr:MULTISPECIES: TetR/AcrR family transcriptional regulator [unclassified Alteromonas]BCO19391.1 hypothetical protein KUC3_22480 [Alteromonas sp. KC3]BCO23353.1 hypothetical protein KUC14_22220 [Alteromonas sp. KC14]